MSWIKTGESSFTSVSSISIDNCFSSLYNNYIILSRIVVTPTGGAALNVRLRSYGIDDSSTNYRRQQLNSSSTTITTSRVTGETYFLAGLGTSYSSYPEFNILNLYNPFNKIRTTASIKIGQNPTANIFINNFVSAHDLPNSYDGFSVTPASGTITGLITVYGIKES